MKKHAVGIVCQSTWELTQKTLQTLASCDQESADFDLYIVDNTGNQQHIQAIKKIIPAYKIKICGLISLSKSIYYSKAANIFLNLAEDYAVRTCIDSGIVFCNIPSVSKSSVKSAKLLRQPTSAAANLGAPRSKSIPSGAGHRIQPRIITSTNFLDHLDNTLERDKLGIASIVALQNWRTFEQMGQILVKKTWRGYPCLMGKCYAISKKCFDTIGYFDERLPTFTDLEYSQRAMKNGISVGYVPKYWVMDYGFNPNVSQGEQDKEKLANQTVQIDNEIRKDKLDTQWLAVSSRIKKQLEQANIINMV